MPVEKTDLYIPGQNVTNMGNNVDYNRVANDKTSITVNFSNSPATVTVKAGSILESNGSNYKVSGDTTFAMANTTDNYIEFDDSLLPAGFSSASSRGTFDPAKQGFYSGGGNTVRTLKWYIDQDLETIELDLDTFTSAGQDSIFTRNLQSHKIETGLGVNIVTINRPVSPTYSDPILIKKPCTLFINFIPDPGGTGSMREEFYYNGGWVVSDLPGLSTDFRQIARPFNPGLYRWRLTQLTDFVDLSIWLIGCYGSTSLISPEVYEINP